MPSRLDAYLRSQTTSAIDSAAKDNDFVTTAFLGLVLSIVIWWAMMQAIVWSWTRRVSVAASRNVDVDSLDLRPITVAAIARRHPLGWTVALAVFFTILAISNFPLWQRLGLTGVLAIIYGSTWLAKSEPGEQAESEGFARKVGSNLWYWVLAVGEWVGYFGAIVFATELLVQVLD
jgi:hypothetical protein